ncbi:MAG: phosphatidylserine/phosphatidylglycerophosphate/cardiolipin synthase family protein [Gammaproteobacteria bacterium]|nr:phosphatidylserine/phosphatidylglycerophosphate/cardiolipin synthase family protein [Gammaproteobacteria bacterium]
MDRYLTLMGILNQLFLDLRTLKFGLLWFFSFSLLVGCASIPPQQLATNLAARDMTQPMYALEAYRDSKQFYLKYRQGDQIYYAGGNWTNFTDFVETPTSSKNYTIPKLTPLLYHQNTPWESPPQEQVTLPIFSLDEWNILRDRLLKNVVPRDGSGVVVDFLETEYFLYYDETGSLNSSRFVDKPRHRVVHNHLDFDDFLDQGRPILESFLKEQGIQAKELIFNTGDTGTYSLPFLYINTEHRYLMFAHNIPLKLFAISSSPELRTGQALGHVMHSHLTNLYARPVSSLYRLFFVVADTTRATLLFDWTVALENKPVPPLSDAPPMNMEQWEMELDKISNRNVSSGSVDILVDGKAYFTRLIESLGMAKESIKLQTYIFDNDDYALQIADLLKQRSKENIEVQILLDGIGTISATMAESESLPEHYQPPASVKRMLEKDSKIDVRQKANPWMTGDHVKSTILDENIAFIGGMNIGREYRYDWHDLMLEINGPVVDMINQQFDKAWAHAGFFGDIGYLGHLFRSQFSRPTESTPGKYPLRVLLTEPGNYEIYKSQLKAIQRSQSYIYIENAYFTDDRMLRELVFARRRGVDVRVIIPLETDHGPISRSNVLAANLMLNHGIRVYIYPGFSHVKAAIYDGWATLGSANFDRLSFRINRELNIASSHPEFTQQLMHRLFEPDFSISTELTEPVPGRWRDYLDEIMGDYLY